MFFSARNFKRLAFKPIQATINHIDFVKIVKSIADSEAGRAWDRRIGPMAPDFADQEDIIRHTVQLAQADLAERGEEATHEELDKLARMISCRYDFDLHLAARNAIYTGLEHVFVHDDLDRLFVSEDRRELKHLETLRQARRDGMGVVYLVNHSSHVDEFIAAVVLNQLGLGLPLFAAGANMMATPSLEKVLMIASYLIIRKGAGRAYLASLFNYCRALCELGKQQGIFLEAWSGGARTRDGSLRYPRRLVTLQGALASDKDVMVQPVSISYSIVPEDLVLAERAGARCWINGTPYFRNWIRRPHRPLRAFWGAMNALYGRAYMTLCRPARLSELEEMRGREGSDLTRDEFAALYSMKEIARDKKIMASHLAARALVRARREQITDLEESARIEMQSLSDYHQRNFGQEPDFEDFIRRHTLAEVLEDGLATLGRRKVIARSWGRTKMPKVLANNGLQYYATHADRRLYSPSAKENTVIVGAGSLGYGLACLIGNRTLEDKRYHNSSLTMFDCRNDLVASLVETRFHPVHFPEIRLPKNVFITPDVTAAYRKATEVLVTLPVEAVENQIRRMLDEARQPLNVIIATQGFDPATHRLPIQIAGDLLAESGRHDVNLLALSGPVTPEMMTKGLGGALVLAGPLGAAKHLAEMFRLEPFRVFVCDDPIGVQLAAVMGQVYSVLGAYLRKAENMKGREEIGAFVAETSAETMALALALGGREETFMADNPAWVAEYVAAGLGGPGTKFGLRAGTSMRLAKRFAREWEATPPEDLKEKSHRLIGYHGIRSACLTARARNLNLPRLEQAYGLFWGE